MQWLDVRLMQVCFGIGCCGGYSNVGRRLMYYSNDGFRSPLLKYLIPLRMRVRYLDSPVLIRGPRASGRPLFPPCGAHALQLLAVKVAYKPRLLISLYILRSRLSSNIILSPTKPTLSRTPTKRPRWVKRKIKKRLRS